MKIWNRLRTKAGESLVESMLSILILALASLMFLGMSNAATEINRETEEVMQEYHVVQNVREVDYTRGRASASYGSRGLVSGYVFGGQKEQGQ